MISKKHDKHIITIKSDWNNKTYSIYWNDNLNCYKILDKKNKTCGYDWSELDEIISFINSRLLNFA